MQIDDKHRGKLVWDARRVYAYRAKRFKLFPAGKVLQSPILATNSFATLKNFSTLHPVNLDLSQETHPTSVWLMRTKPPNTYGFRGDKFSSFEEGESWHKKRWKQKSQSDICIQLKSNEQHMVQNEEEDTRVKQML